MCMSFLSFYHYSCIAHMFLIDAITSSPGYIGHVLSILYTYTCKHTFQCSLLARVFYSFSQFQETSSEQCMILSILHTYTRKHILQCALLFHFWLVCFSLSLNFRRHLVNSAWSFPSSTDTHANTPCNVHFWLVCFSLSPNFRRYLVNRVWHMG